MTSIFVNLPTTDLERAKAFYTALGVGINPLFTDENAACIVMGREHLLHGAHEGVLRDLHRQAVADPKTHAQALIAISRDSRDDVDTVLAAGLADGGTEPKPVQDYGFMYSRDLEDPDGNILEFLYMDPEAAAKGPEVYMAEHAQA